MRIANLRWTVGGAVLVFVLALTACSSGDSSSGGIPTGGGSAAHTAPTAAGTLDQALIDYAHCMRAHGVTIADPAPRPGHSGLSLDVPNLSTPGVSAADGECKQFLAPVVAAKQGAASARITPAAMRALLAYSRCMRSHDIPLLDPDPSDGHISLGDIAGINNDVGRQDPRFHSADAACRHLLPHGFPDDGTGPP
jgi:hypothetical protein